MTVNRSRALPERTKNPAGSKATKKARRGNRASFLFVGWGSVFGRDGEGAAAPFFFRFGEQFHAAQFLKLFPDVGVLGAEDARQDQSAARFDHGKQFFLTGDQRGGKDVCRHDVVLHPAIIFFQRGDIEGQIVVRNAVDLCVFPGDRDGVGIDVKGGNRTASQFVRGDGKDARSRARIQKGKRSAGSFLRELINGAETGFRGGVLSGPETHTRVQRQHGLTGGSIVLFPRGLDRQAFGNDNGLEAMIKQIIEDYEEEEEEE